MIAMTAIHLITLFAIRSIAVNICDQYEQKPRIKAAIRFGNYTVLRFADRKVYRFENFMFANNGFTYGQTEDISQMWNRVNNTRIGSFPVEEVTAFPVMYNKNGSITKRIVHIIHEKNEDIDQLFSYQTLHNQNLTDIVEEERYSLLVYKYRPEPKWTQWHDPLTLVNLIAKFPDTAIHDNLKAILSFPLNNPNLPTRLFVYYKEEPTNLKELKSIFKRHVMIGRPVEFLGTGLEMNWVHDKTSGSCFELPIQVEAAFHLTDYDRIDRNSYTFDIMEFSKDHFFIRRVTITGDRVRPELEYLSVGPIGSIFGCDTTVPDLPPGLTKAKKRVTRYRAVVIVVWILICLFLAITVFVFVRLSQLQQQWNRLAQYLIEGRLIHIANDGRSHSQEQRALPTPNSEATHETIGTDDHSEIEITRL